MNYELEIITDGVFGGKGYQTYRIINYDGDIEKLKEYVKKLNSESSFWISWYIKSETNGILEKEVDPLD